MTNRLYNGAVTGALLLIDEPFPAQPVPSSLFPPTYSPMQIFCAPGGVPGVPCPETGTVPNGSLFSFAQVPYHSQSNIFMGTVINSNTIKWASIPLDPPGGSGALMYMRLTGIRADASLIGLSGSLIPSQVSAFLTVSGPGAPTLVANNFTEAYIRAGQINSTASNAPIPQCGPHNVSLIGGTGLAAFDGSVTLREGYAASFRARDFSYTSDNRPAPQNVPGFAYNSESNLYIPDLFTAFPASGLADFGTRVRVSIADIAPGTRIFAPTAVPITGGAYWGPGSAQLQMASTDMYGVSSPGLTAVASTASVNGTPVAEMSYSGTSAYAVYEVVHADPAAVESAEIPIAVAFNSTPQNPINLGTAHVLVSLVPQGGAAASLEQADASAPIPRFTSSTPSYVPEQIYSVAACGPDLAGEYPNNLGNIPLNATLRWGSLVSSETFDVYFGTQQPPPLVASGIRATSYTPGTLNPSTTYYWKVVAKNAWGAASSSNLSFTTIATAAYLTLTHTHTGNFKQGQNGATYVLTVSNGAASSATSGQIQVIESLPEGLTLVSMSGSGWTCYAGSNSCTRTDVLNPGASYPPLTVTVNVAPNASTPLVAQADVIGFGLYVSGSGDSTTVTGISVSSIVAGCFAACVQGEASHATTWTITPAAGMLYVVPMWIGISPVGMGGVSDELDIACYTPASSGSGPASVVLTAASASDPTLSASLTLDGQTGAPVQSNSTPAVTKGTSLLRRQRAR